MKDRAIRRMFIALLLSVLASQFGAGVAQARMSPQEKQQAQAAQQHMLHSEYADAIPLYADLFAHHSDVQVYLWNLALCHHHLSHVDEAIAKFRLLLDTFPNISATERAEVDAYIKEMETLKKQQADDEELRRQQAAAELKKQEEHDQAAKAAETAAAAPAAAASNEAQASAAPSQPATPATAGAVASLAASVDARATTAESPGLRIAALAAGGVGVLALIAGGYYSYQAQSLQDQVMKASKFNHADDSAGNSAHTMQFVMYGIGAAALAAGGALYYLGGSRAEGSSVALLPEVGPGVTGATLCLRF
jgi:hypothetical protein